MGTDYIKYCSDLQQELQNAKDTLVALNDNIRRQRFVPFRNDKTKAQNDGKRANNDIERQGGLPSKRRNQASVFNRLSAAPAVASRSSDEEPRPRLTSRVIRELPTRQEIVEAQGTDSESRARNRRMFGSLMGTLHKFCQEETRLKQKEDKKAQIEKRLEQQQLKERETLKRERESLFLDRKRKQLEIRRLEVKMNRLRDFETWETSMKLVKHHIRTKTKPHIFFKPKVMVKKTETLLSDSQLAIDELIFGKREELTKELKEIENDLRAHEIDCDEVISQSADNNTTNSDIADNGKLNTSQEHQVKDDDAAYANNSPSSAPSEHNAKKAEAETKENKSKNLNNEPALHSSVVVVKNEGSKVE